MGTAGRCRRSVEWMGTDVDLGDGRPRAGELGDVGPCGPCPAELPRPFRLPGRTRAVGRVFLASRTVPGSLVCRGRPGRIDHSVADNKKRAGTTYHATVLKRGPRCGALQADGLRVVRFGEAIVALICHPGVGGVLPEEEADDDEQWQADQTRDSG